MTDDWSAVLAAAVRSARRTAVLAAGNEGRGDDGAGPLVAALLRRGLPPAAGEKLLVLEGNAALLVILRLTASITLNRWGAREAGRFLGCDGQVRKPC